MSFCPMAETCKRMMQKPFSGLGLAIPGLSLIALDILILIEPRVAAWVVAAIFVVLGALLLMIARFIRKIGLGP